MTHPQAVELPRCPPKAIAEGPEIGALHGHRKTVRSTTDTVEQTIGLVVLTAVRKAPVA